MSKKKKKPYLQTKRGRALVTAVAVGIAAVFVLSLIPMSTFDDDRAEEEWKEIRDSIRSMKESATPPIEELQSDERILAVAGSQDNATDDITDGGLIDIVDAYVLSGSITPLNMILGTDRVHYDYWIEPDGTLYQLR